MIIIGVDPHKSVHVASALDTARHQVVATAQVEASLAGYRRLLRWAGQFERRRSFPTPRRGPRREGSGAADLSTTGDQPSIHQDNSCPQTWRSDVRQPGEPASAHQEILLSVDSLPRRALSVVDVQAGFVADPGYVFARVGAPILWRYRRTGRSALGRQV